MVAFYPIVISILDTQKLKWDPAESQGKGFKSKHSENTGNIEEFTKGIILSQ